jgi:hypothetical protein
MTISRMKQLICCLKTRVDDLEEGGGGGGGATQITGPDVSTYNDARGITGDWSFNASLNGGTFFFKVDSSPDIWVSWSVATE